MGVQDFFIRQLMKSKLKDVPEAQREQIMTLVTKNPELFKKIVEAIPTIDALYLQAKNYCPSSAPRCGPGSLSPNQQQSWKPVTSDAWFEPVAAACKLPAAPSSCRPAKK